MALGRGWRRHHTGQAEPRRVRVDVWKAFNGEVGEKGNRDSLILQLSDSFLFIVL